MSLFEVGRVCIKIAGRDAGKKGVILEQLQDHFVLIDGATRRKKVNVKHLEPLPIMIEVPEKASHEEVEKAFQTQGWEVWNTKPKTVAARPRRQREGKQKASQKE